MTTRPIVTFGGRDVRHNISSFFFVLDESTVAEKHTQVEKLEVPSSPSLQGFLNQRVEEDVWLRCWVC